MKMQPLRQLAQRIESKNLAVILKSSAIVFAVLAFYYQDLIIVFADALGSELTSYVLAIPFVFAYLMYRKRKMIQAAIYEHSIKQQYLAVACGILLCATTVLLYFFSSGTFTPLEYHILTLPLFASGLVLVFFNPYVLREVFMPMFFLFFLTPPPTEILYGLGSSLSMISSQASYSLVHALGIPSTLSSEFENPIVIITRANGDSMRFAVDIVCSGIFSLVGFLVFASLVAYITRDKPWKKALTFLIGLPLIYALNVARIIVILLLGYQFGEDVAVQVFHLLGGYVLMFLGTLLLLTISEKIFKTRIFMNAKTASCSNCDSSKLNPEHSFCQSCGRLLEYRKLRMLKADITKIALTAFMILLLLAIQAPVFALTQGPAQIMIETPTGEQGNTQILPQVPGYTLKFLYRDRPFELRARQDFSLQYVYSKPAGIPLWVTIEIAPTISSLHRLETCLITWPITVGGRPQWTQLDLRDVELMQNPPIIGQYFAFQNKNDNHTEVVLYWFESSMFTINGTAHQEMVKISLITYPNSVEEIRAYEQYMLPFASSIAEYWKPMKTWNQAALIISENGLRLAAGTGIILCGIAIFDYIKRRRTRRVNSEIFGKISEIEKQIIDAMNEASRKTTPTTQNVADTYERIAGKKIDTQTLSKHLLGLEEIGMIGNRILNQNDEPVQTWKTNCLRNSPEHKASQSIK